MMVNVPAILVSERCLVCPELELEINRLELSNGERKFYSNDAICTHYYKCKEILFHADTRDKHSNK